MSEAKDYTGKKFGKLTALTCIGFEKRKSRGRLYKWLFLCECGRKVERLIDHVKQSVYQGHVPACSECRARSLPPKTEPTRLEIENQKFGKLTALEPTGSVNHRRYAIWRFKCECGRIVERSAGDVVSIAKQGFQPSCGDLECSKFVNLRLPGNRGAFKRLVDSYRRNAGYRGYEWLLTDEQAHILFQSNCHYCGAPPSQLGKAHNKSHAPPYQYNGIDRIDNSKGYVVENVVSACKLCNKAKGTLTIEEFNQWIERLIHHNLK